ncbi:MAG: phage head morphogenesis protein [Chloroflexi bacterium]|nr:phage head morphogenesis protein [Chloroflexota bacterium]
MSRLSDAVSRYRQQILDRDQATAGDLTELYGASFAHLSAQFDFVVRQIQDLQRRGETVTTDKVFRYTRASALLEQIGGEIEHFSRYADTRIAQAQMVATHDAQAHSLSLIQEAAGIPAQDLPPAFRHLNRAAVENMAGRLSDGSPLRELLGTLAPQAVQQARETLVSGIAEGTNPNEVALQLKEDLQVPLTRARTIARTETLSTYRDVTLANYQANDDICAGWQWQCTYSPRTCAACLAMDGQVFGLDVPFSSHVCCRCTAVPVTKSWAELGFTGIPETNEQDRETGAEWFDRQPEKTQMEILGPSKLREYQSGSLTLRDLVGYRVDPQWGPQRWERSLTQVRRGEFKEPAGLSKKPGRQSTPKAA